MSHEQEQFWTVVGRYANGKATGASTVIHTSAEAADAEARRLASAHLGTRFYVMAAAVGYVVEKPEPVAVTIKRPDAAEPDQDAPTVTIRGGAYYRLRNGEVVGPAHLVFPGRAQPWKIDGYYYRDDGTCPYLPERDAIAEVPAP